MSRDGESNTCSEIEQSLLQPVHTWAILAKCQAMHSAFFASIQTLQPSNKKPNETLTNAPRKKHCQTQNSKLDLGKRSTFVLTRL
jgi:hypothetical protein